MNPIQDGRFKQLHPPTHLFIVYSYLLSAAAYYIIFGYDYIKFNELVFELGREK